MQFAHVLRTVYMYKGLLFNTKSKCEQLVLQNPVLLRMWRNILSGDKPFPGARKVRGLKLQIQKMFFSHRETSMNV